MKLATYKPSAARHIMIYGPPKSGKTILAMLLANYGYRLWYCDGEDSIKSAWAVDADNKRIISDAAIDNIELIKLPDTVFYPIMGETVLKIVKGGPCNVCHLHGKVSCIPCSKNPDAIITTIDVNTFTPKDVLVIDSGTQLSKSLMHNIKKKEIASGAEEMKPERDDYMKQGFLLDRIMSIIQVAPWNCIMISHDAMVEMEDKSKQRIVPVMGTNNFSRESAKYFDDVVYCEKINNKLKAFSSATYANAVISGSRSGKLIEKEGSRGLVELFE